MALRFVVFFLPLLLLLEGVAAEATTHRVRGDAPPGTQVVSGEAPFTPLQLDNVSSAHSSPQLTHSAIVSQSTPLARALPDSWMRSGVLSSPKTRSLTCSAPSLAPTQPVTAATEPPQPQPSDPAWKGSSRWPATGNPAHTHAKRASSIHRITVP